jgi:hypothetical protein
MSEKLDGYMCTLYFYANEWQIATISTADGSETITEFSQKSVKELFYEIFKAGQMEFPKDTCCCYSFMIMSHQLLIKNSGILSQTNKENICMCKF